MTPANADGLVVDGLRVESPTANGVVRGADDVSLRVRPGERLGLVGESGSGKTTTALAILQMIRAPGRIARGDMTLNGTDLRALRGEALRRSRLSLASYIPQGAMNSLNPVLTVAAQLRDALADHGGPRNRRAADALVAEALAGVDLPPTAASRFPHELSGGMKQRVCIAIGMLRATILANILRLNQRHGIAVVYITHDITTAFHVADEVLVLFRGHVVERGSAEAVIGRPRHPYTQLLVSSIPWPDLDRHWGDDAQRGGGEHDPAPDAQGCPFAARCPATMPICRAQSPPMVSAGGSSAACHLLAPASSRTLHAV